MQQARCMWQGPGPSTPIRHLRHVPLILATLFLQQPAWPLHQALGALPTPMQQAATKPPPAAPLPQLPRRARLLRRAPTCSVQSPAHSQPQAPALGAQPTAQGRSREQVEAHPQA